MSQEVDLLRHFVSLSETQKTRNTATNIRALPPSSQHIHPEDKMCESSSHCWLMRVGTVSRCETFFTWPAFFALREAAPPGRTQHMVCRRRPALAGEGWRSCEASMWDWGQPHPWDDAHLLLFRGLHRGLASIGQHAHHGAARARGEGAERSLRRTVSKAQNRYVS